MENKDLMKEFEAEFQKLKSELNFKTSLEELDNIFFIKDYIKHQGFVSSQMPKQICSRIVETYNQWLGYLNSLIIPNQSYIPLFSEQEMLDEKEKEDIYKLITKTMVLTSKNTVIALGKSEESQGDYIDEAVDFWNNTFSKKISKLAHKINKGWIEKIDEKENKNSDEGHHIG